MRGVVLAMALLTPVAAAADPVVGDCGERVSAEFLAEPWEENTASFANGAVRAAVIDTVEPAAAPVHLMVLTPPLDEAQMRRCRLVSAAPGTGFDSLDFRRRQVSYDPRRGLILTLQGRAHDPSGAAARPVRLTVTIDQRSGDVQAALR